MANKVEAMMVWHHHHQHQQRTVLDNVSHPVVQEHLEARILSTSSTQEAPILSCSTFKHNNSSSNSNRPKLPAINNLNTRSHSRPKPSHLSTPNKPLPQVQLKQRSTVLPTPRSH